MLTVANIDAEFLPNQEFHIPKDASAPRTTGCNRVGLGQVQKNSTRFQCRQDIGQTFDSQVGKL
jgi:hypothetical protein